MSFVNTSNPQSWVSQTKQGFPLTRMPEGPEAATIEDPAKCQAPANQAPVAEEELPYPEKFGHRSKSMPESDQSRLTAAPTGILDAYIQQFREEEVQVEIQSRERAFRRQRSNPLPSLSELEDHPHDFEHLNEDSSISSEGSMQIRSKSAPDSPAQSPGNLTRTRTPDDKDQKPELWERRKQHLPPPNKIKILSDFLPQHGVGTPGSVRSAPGAQPSPAIMISRDAVELGHSMGEDGFGVIYKGKWMGTDARVRILKPKVGHDISRDDAVNMINDVVSSMRHPNLEMHLAVVQQDSSRMMMTVTELLPYSLAQVAPILAKKPKNQVFTYRIRWGLELSRALCYLHTSSPAIVVEDLRPSQVCLDEDLHLKIVDAGLKNEMRKRNLDSARKELSVYAAPEVFLGTEANASADIYSYGMILCFLLLGKDPPAQGADITVQQIRQSKQKGYEPLLELITQCAQTERGRRPNANTCIKAMEELKNSSSKAAASPNGCMVM